MPQVILSGVQPTGALHLGNYLGAIKRFAQMQDTAECLFCVVDLHAITVKQDPKVLATNTRAVAAAYLACGIKPTKAFIFAQSAVPEHTELAWVLNCVARVGWLDRMTQFRQKTGAAPDQAIDNVIDRLTALVNDARSTMFSVPHMTVMRADMERMLAAVAIKRDHREKASVGLYTYPVLQAADILLYRATQVPVGDDQKQHLNLAADIARKFNTDYSDIFPIPQPLIGATGARVMDLKTGLSKMSKSDADDSSRINLTDDDDTIARKIKRATADTRPIPSEVEGLAAMPAVRNLVTIMAALRDITVEEVLGEYAGKGYGVFKPDLANVVVNHLSPIRRQINDHMEFPFFIDGVLEGGRREASERAQETMTAVRNAVGFWTKMDGLGHV